MQTNTEKKLFSLKSFAFENILQCKMFYIEKNEALKENQSLLFEGGITDSQQKRQ